MNHRIDRRSLVRGVANAALLSSPMLSIFGANHTLALDGAVGDFDRKLDAFMEGIGQSDGTRADREGQRLVSPFAEGQEKAPSRAKPSSTPISSRAINMVLACEVTSKAKYIRSYQAPTWPKGQSGVTVGVGYDVGYVTKAWLYDDWTAYLPVDQIAALAAACGVTGDAAAIMCAQLQTVTVGWDAAYKQFVERVLPHWIGETEAALPNTSFLGPDSLGALVSLVYNRGPSFGKAFDPVKDPIDRYREMRAIKAHMASKQFEMVPDDLRSMTRIWKDDPDMKGLLTRRELEADLFEVGLKS